MRPIYEPKGKAKEYGDLAINIYTGCPHRCFYCFAPTVLHKDRTLFHSIVEPRPGIVQAVKDQIKREHITGKLIHLCFTCDPYPTGYDSLATRAIIEIIKESGNHVQILTKGDGTRDFDLLDCQDWYGVTYDGEVRQLANTNIFLDLAEARYRGIQTWVSYEPVLNANNVLWSIENVAKRQIANKVKIGKLNYHQSFVDNKSFGQAAELICQQCGIDYYIKDSLRKEMNK